MMGAALLAFDHLDAGTRDRRPARRAAQRRSGTSRTSRCACCPRCARRMWWRARTRAGRACCWTATGFAPSWSRTTSTTRPPRASELVKRMREGAVVALVSDAGMPLVSDPGYLLVRACVAAGLPVEVLPGPSAAITALVASGLPADEWHFHGFLPRKKGELRECALALRRDARGLRVAPSGARHAGAARRAGPGAGGGALPRAHEGPRGDRSRHGRRARRALRGQPAARGGRPGACSARAPAVRLAPTPPRWTPCASWSTRAPIRARRPRWSPA